MSGWIVVQIILNIGFVAAALVCWARLNRPQKDDPRLSRGLQLLQSKIAILEDLSDRTDMQVKQLSTLLDQKGREVQEYVANAQTQIHKVEDSIQKSMDVSKIFQDKIPHKEIVERQNTIKYVQAARLANQGMSVDEIAEKIDIPRSELEFIAKVNKNKLMFSEEHLPEWVQEPSLEAQPQIRPRDFSSVFESSAVNPTTQEDDKKIQDEFKKAIEEVKAKDLARENSMTNVVAENVSESVSEGIQVAKNKISDFAERILNPYFVDKAGESEAPVPSAPVAPVENAASISDQVTSKKIIKGESAKARAIKAFVFKNLDKDI